MAEYHKELISFEAYIKAANEQVQEVLSTSGAPKDLFIDEFHMLKLRGIAFIANKWLHTIENHAYDSLFQIKHKFHTGVAKHAAASPPSMLMLSLQEVAKAEAKKEAK